MNYIINKLDFIRYGSPYFMYAVSLLIISSPLRNVVGSVVSLLSFAVCTGIIGVIMLLLKNKYIFESQYVKNIFPIMIATSFISVGYEIINAQNCFYVASDYTSSLLGKVIIGLLIISASLLCAKFGVYSLIKITNIIFIVPALVLLLTVVSVTMYGINTSFICLKLSDGYICDAINGIVAAGILFSDFLLIGYMQNKEGCCFGNYDIKAYIFTSVVITVISCLQCGLFGAEAFKTLLIPCASSVGVIFGFDFEETVMLALSVCFIFRITCKISFTLSLLFDFFENSKLKIFKISAVGFFLSSIIGTFIATNEYIRLYFDNFIAFLLLFSFVILPFSLAMLQKK